MERLKQFFAEYGLAAILVYWAIFFAVLFGFVGAIYLGFEVETAGATAGTFVSAYLATKLTQPLRIAAAFVLTPIVAKAFPRLSTGIGGKLKGDDDPPAATETQSQGAEG